MKNCPCAHYLLHVIVEDCAHRGRRCPTPYIAPSRKRNGKWSRAAEFQAPPGATTDSYNEVFVACSSHMWVVRPVREVLWRRAPVDSDGFEPSTSALSGR